LRSYGGIRGLHAAGNPDNPRMPPWQPYDTTARATMTIDATCQSVNDFRGGDRVAASALRPDPYNRSALFSYKD
jgi:para-nitrobenzyl esterase